MDEGSRAKARPPSDQVLKPMRLGALCESVPALTLDCLCLQVGGLLLLEPCVGSGSKAACRNLAVVPFRFLSRDTTDCGPGHGFDAAFAHG